VKTAFQNKKKKELYRGEKNRIRGGDFNSKERFSGQRCVQRYKKKKEETGTEKTKTKGQPRVRIADYKSGGGKQKKTNKNPPTQKGESGKRKKKKGKVQAVRRRDRLRSAESVPETTEGRETPQPVGKKVARGVKKSRERHAIGRGEFLGVH